MKKTAQRLTGINTGTYERATNDFYPTPAKTTQALLDRVKFDENIWEPACGNGAISEVLKATGYNVLSSDLVDRGYNGMVENFLTYHLNDHSVPMQEDIMIAQGYDIITNPPFSLATEFVLQAKKLAKRKIAMLLRINFLEGVARYNELWQDEQFPLSQVLVFSRRQKFMREGIDEKEGAGLICFAWFVWDREHKGKATIDWI